MDLFQTIVLALIQGLTEFLPISSSAHLILPAQLLGWEDQGLVFDVAVHVGTLLAVVIYFRADIFQLISQWLRAYGGLKVEGNTQQAHVRLAWQIIVATLPAITAGLLFSDFIEAHLRSTLVIAITTIVFGLLLALADRKAKNNGLSADLPAILHLAWPVAIAIGLAQAMALVPGTSRSGITITMAILLGLSKTDAARFSFLLSIPIILAAGAYESLKLISEAPVFDVTLLLVGVVVSALSAWCCIALFLKWIEKIGLMPFVWYRLLLGVVLFVFFV